MTACGRAASFQYRLNLSVEQHTAKEELLPCVQTCVNKWQVQAYVCRKTVLKGEEHGLLFLCCKHGA